MDSREVRGREESWRLLGATRSGGWARNSGAVLGLLGSVLLTGGCSQDGTEPEPEPEIYAVIDGRAHAADGGALTSLWAVWRPGNGASADSSQLAADGVFRIEVTSPASAGELRIGGPDAGEYHPFLYPFEVAELVGVDVVMVPRSWTVRRGPFAGEVVATSLDLAVDDNADKYLYSYFFGQPHPRDAPVRYLLDLITWPVESFPVGVALDRLNSSYDLTPADSAEIWTVLNRMEEVMGLDFFQPVQADPDWWPVPTGPYDEDRVPGVIRLVSRPPLWGARPGSGEEPSVWEGDLGVWAAPGRFQAFRMNHRYLDSGTLIIGALEPLRLADGWIPWETVVVHEMMHVLGVGHTCRIESPMGPCLRTLGPSRHDVAYMELLRSVVDLQRSLGVPFGIVPGMIGERNLLLGLPALPDMTG